LRRDNGKIKYKFNYKGNGPAEYISANYVVFDEKNKEQQKEIIKNVDLLLQLNEKLQTATVPNQFEQIKSRIAHSEDKINEIVYGLYGLTKEEIKIIERS